LRRTLLPLIGRPAMRFVLLRNTPITPPLCAAARPIYERLGFVTVSTYRLFAL